MTPEAPLEETGAGLAPGGPGWFVVNLRDAAWATSPDFGAACMFESPAHRSDQLGINIRVLQPGQPNGLYHAEDAEEAFLVLSGEALLIVEDEERPLRAWDFVRFPAGTRHILVGAGDGPCTVLMAGARHRDVAFDYPASEVAARHGAAATEPTTEAREAYAGRRFPEPGRPEGWETLPWAS